VIAKGVCRFGVDADNPVHARLIRQWEREHRLGPVSERGDTQPFGNRLVLGERLDKQRLLFVDSQSLRGAAAVFDRLLNRRKHLALIARHATNNEFFRVNDVLGGPDEPVLIRRPQPLTNRFQNGIARGRIDEPVKHVRDKPVDDGGPIVFFPERVKLLALGYLFRHVRDVDGD
jgi:hypothetical protein